MRFCELIESSDQKKKYNDHVKNIVCWYKKNVEKYAAMLRTEMALQTINRDLMDSRKWAEEQGLSYTFDAKQSYFNVADALIKLILACYSAGPSKEFYETHGIVLGGANHLPDESNLKDSWLDCKDNAYQLSEVLAKVLRDNGVDFEFDLQALQRDRADRAPITHAAVATACLSAIRCYRSIRSMLIFLAPEYKDELRVLEYTAVPKLKGEYFDYNEFLAAPCNFSFDDDTTILLVDSVHDVSVEQRTLVANLPWDLVVDLDGYSDCGGLLSCVKHNRLMREVLTLSKAKGPTELVNGNTLWYRAGEYQFYLGNPSPQFDIPSYTWFCRINDPRPQKIYKKQKMNTIRDILKVLLKKADRYERRINIVALTDDKTLVQVLTEALNNINLGDYFLTWVGLSDKDTDGCKEFFYDDEEVMNEQFRRINCPTALFFDTLIEYSRDFTPRVSLETEFTLAAGGKRVPISENDRNNLLPFFDVLYDGCEKSNESQKQTEAFYLGNTASWCTIANDDAVPIEKEEKREFIVNRIKKLISVAQVEPQKRLFFIQHTPGLGGTTFVRQLAWILHKEYAVLSVKQYDNSIGSLLVKLYDNVLNREPIVILAEDTLFNIKALCDCICKLQRRCILLMAVRNNNSLVNDYQHAERQDMIKLTDTTVDKLRSRFQDMSRLSPALIQKRNQEFNSFITSTMRTPFIIGLYYMEKDFNIVDYVHKAFEGCSLRKYADVIGCLAMCDEFCCKNFPASLVNSWLEVTMRNDFLRELPTASSIIVKERSGIGIDMYHFKHPLLSSEFLQLYCRKYFNDSDNRGSALYYLTTELIKKVANMGDNLKEDSLNLISLLMIQNKSGGEGESSLSMLLEAIGTNVYQRNLMHCLAETFQPLADEIHNGQRSNPDCELTSLDRLKLRLVSHAYAHLGKLYSQGEKNFKKAEEMMELAINYMPDSDPLIYHMHGKALLDEMKDKWKSHREGVITSEEFNIWDSEVSRTQESFHKTCEYGSPEYGLPSLLDLYESYLEFIYRVKGIHSKNELNQLNSDHWKIYQNFLSVLEYASFYGDLGEVAEDRIRDIKDRFSSQIMFGDFGKAVEYYQNKVDILRSSNDVDGFNRALRGLVLARINTIKAKDSRGNIFKGVDPGLKEKLLKDINELLQRPYNPSSYVDYLNYTRMYHYWMLLGKDLEVRLDEGLEKARQWLEMEERSKRPHNPEPYYYVKVLEYLNWKDGSKQASNSVHKLNDQINYLDKYQRFNWRWGRSDKMRDIRDIFVHGKGMGQLMDVTAYHDEMEILNALCDNGLKPQIFEGKLGKFVHQYGVLRLYQPSYWCDEEVWLETGKQVVNSVSSYQENHNIIFIGGFAVSRLRALPSSARDKSADENFDLNDIMKAVRKRKLSL